MPAEIPRKRYITYAQVRELIMELVPEFVDGGRRIALCTIHRWSRRGLTGRDGFTHKLKTYYAGSTPVSTADDVHEFFAALGREPNHRPAAESSAQPQAAKPIATRNAHAEALKNLAGI